MGEEFQMARSEIFGRSLLLATGGSGLFSSTPISRDKREEAITTNKRTKGSKTKAATPKSKISPKAEDFDGGSTRRKRHRRSNKDRQPDRGAKGADSTPRWSASELGIEWPGSYCPDGKPHTFVESYQLDGGALFRCSGCKRHKWLPYSFEAARDFDNLVDSLKVNKAYHKLLDSNRTAKVMIAKLQYLWYARQDISDDRIFTKLIISVMNEKEYDRKEAA